jgi:hypothetical protein
MLTKDILFGFNILTLAGFLLMGIALHLVRTSKASTLVGIVLMLVGTLLAIGGLYPDRWLN